MAYDARDFPHKRLNNHLACKELLRVQKCKDDVPEASANLFVFDAVAEQEDLNDDSNHD